MSTANPVKTDAIPAEWTRMSLDEFWHSGLLRYVNRELWPYGVAVTLRTDEDGVAVEMYVTKTEPYEPITSGDGPGEEAEWVERLTRWMRTRLTDG